MFTLLPIDNLESYRQKVMRNLEHRRRQWSFDRRQSKRHYFFDMLDKDNCVSKSHRMMVIHNPTRHTTQAMYPKTLRLNFPFTKANLDRSGSNQSVGLVRGDIAPLTHANIQIRIIQENRDLVSMGRWKISYKPPKILTQNIIRPDTSRVFDRKSVD
ncbi:hypothetical protein X989_5077 [Burkholderia pseudomallei MSHR4378]|nr:hypothetical protein X989_5077 [Burkholderia pseudomallei MSHR4378]